MRPEDVQALLRAEPFQPLQVRVNDGKTYVITHPKLSMVTRQRLVLGFPDPTDENLAGEVMYLGWSVIEAIDPVIPQGAVA